MDLLKTIAIWDVVLSHVAAPAFTAGPVGSLPWLIALFWASISHVSVSLFLMASGQLLLAPERDLTLRKLYTRSIPRLLLALLFWAGCYQVFNMVLWDCLTWPNIIAGLKALVLFRHEEHLYYLHIMLLVYALLPCTRLLARHGDKKLLAYLLGLWFLLGIVYPTVRTFWPFTLITGIPTQWRLNMTYASVGYTLLGFFLARHVPKPDRRWPWVLCLTAGVGLTFGGAWFQSAAAGALDTHFLEGMGVSVCLTAVGVWGLCRTVRLSPRAARFVTYISRASFCIFLTHVFFLKLLAARGLNALAGPVVLTVPLLTALIITLSCLVYALLSRVPIVSRWLL